jgi:hypothetical protein
MYLSKASTTFSSVDRSPNNIVVKKTDTTHVNYSIHIQSRFNIIAKYFVESSPSFVQSIC